jgi:chromosome segregation protein
LAVLEERRRALNATQASLVADQERLTDEFALAREQLGEAENNAAAAGQESSDASGQLSDVEQSLQTQQAERAQLEEALAAVRSRQEALSIQRSENQARLDELAERIQARQEKLTGSQAHLAETKATAARAEEQLVSARRLRETAQSELAQAEAGLQEKRKALEVLDAARRAALDVRAKHEAEHSRVHAQRDVLEQAEQSLAGYAQGARYLLEAVQQARLKGTRGALSAALDVPADLETAIAAALGESLDAVLLQADETENALSLLESDESGRAALLPLEPHHLPQKLSQPDDPDCVGVAIDLVKVPPGLEGAVSILLGQVLVVRNRAAARRLVKTQAAPAKLVTLQGEVFHADGRILAGKSGKSSTLSRPRQKREFDSQIQELAANLQASNAEVDRLSSDLAEAQRVSQQAESEVHEARSRMTESQEAERQAELEYASARRNMEWQTTQVEQLEEELREAAALQKGLAEAQSEVDSKAAAERAQAHDLRTKVAAIQLDELQQQVAYWHTRVAVAEQAMSGAAHRVEERSKEVERLETRRAQIEIRIDEARTALQELESGKSTSHEQEAGLQKQIEELAVRMEPAEKELESAELEEARLQAAEDEAQRTLSHLERSFGQLQLDQTRKQEALTNLRQKITDDFGLVMFEYAEDVSGPVPLPLDGMVEQLPVITELPLDMEDILSRQRHQLRRMGPINPEAKAEFESESSRYDFMTEQVEDLRKAELDLKQVIEELDELTQREFSRTFDAVDKQFRETFVRLFGGGSARLALTDPENLVETGIEIEARLPGRREQGLASLSGGERSLTAIALVFALLRVSPTPVCVMDEVDAMLDEANVGRFRDLLVELSQDTQFIVITHNRNTVQAADVIYGITMGRDSASQVISLRLDQVTDEMLSRG